MTKKELKSLIKEFLSADKDSLIMENKYKDMFLEKRQEYINTFLKNKDSFMKRYGKNAENVMVGRAVNNANSYIEKMKKQDLKELVRTILTKEEPVKESKNKLTEDWGSSDQSIMNQSIHKDLGNPTEFPSPFDPEFEAAVESAVDFYWNEWDEYRTDRDGLINHAKRAYYRSYFPNEFKGFTEMFSENLNNKNINEDIDLGHQDDEPHMIKGELYQIGKYAMELYSMLEKYDEMNQEVDFPAWWQAKITTAKNMMSGVKHYLEFEINEPAIDAAVDKAIGKESHEGEPEAHMMDERKAKKDYDGDGKIESSEEEYKGARSKAIEKAKGLAGAIAKKIKEDVVKGPNVEKDSKGKWRVLSGKTGKRWPQTYDTKEDAENAIKAYHASK
jgi:hypothetical protein